MTKTELRDRLAAIRSRWATGRLEKDRLNIEVEDYRDISWLALDLLPALADQVERLKYDRPLNGDGHNYALSKVLDLLMEVGGERVAPTIQAVMADRERRHAEMQARLDAENARLHELRDQA